MIVIVLVLLVVYDSTDIDGGNAVDGSCGKG